MSFLQGLAFHEAIRNRQQKYSQAFNVIFCFISAFEIGGGVLGKDSIAGFRFQSLCFVTEIGGTCLAIESCVPISEGLSLLLSLVHSKKEEIHLVHSAHSCGRGVSVI